MHRLLLNASISDDVSFGYTDRFIQDPTLEERIIKFRTSTVLRSIDQNDEIVDRKVN